MKLTVHFCSLLAIPDTSKFVNIPYSLRRQVQIVYYQDTNVYQMLFLFKYLFCSKVKRLNLITYHDRKLSEILRTQPPFPDFFW